MKGNPMHDVQNNQEKTIKIHINPGIEYKYRDIFNIHISTDEVTLEFGNLQRGSNQGVIKDIIVMTPANAMRLQQALAQSIETMQQKIREINSKNANN